MGGDRLAAQGSSANPADAPLDEGILQALWLSRDELVARRPQHRSPQVLRCIDDYLGGRRFGLELLVDLE